LDDEVRIELFRKAIAEVVRRGDVVTEIGTGLGTFAFFAALAGAQRVYAIERSDIIEVAKEIAEDNKLKDRVCFVKGNSTEIDLPEKADVLIIEDFGPFFMDDGLNEVIRDAKERFLKNKGEIIPSEIELYIAPLGSYEVYKKLDLWSEINDKLYGMDFSHTRKLAMNNCYKEKISTDMLLSKPKLLTRISLLLDDNFSFQKSVSLSSKKGIIYGLMGWFRAKLSNETIIDNSPSAPPTSWGQLFIPIETPLEVKEKEEIRIDIACLQSNSMKKTWWSWRVETIHESAEGTTFNGFPLSLDDLKKGDRRYIPTLSAKGEVMRFILNHFNGVNSIEGISLKLYSEFPGKFRSFEQACAEVSRVVKKIG
jgi:ubiquinone/menaquinone biosynthesis C-methylase UbiE